LLDLERCRAFRVVVGLLYWIARMALAHCLITAGGLLLVAGFIGFALQRNELHSAARI
jgi:hypothetical protein